MPGGNNGLGSRCRSGGGTQTAPRCSSSRGPGTRGRDQADRARSAGVSRTLTQPSSLHFRLRMKAADQRRGKWTHGASRLSVARSTLRLPIVLHCAPEQGLSYGGPLLRLGPPTNGSVDPSTRTADPIMTSGASGAGADQRRSPASLVRRSGREPVRRVDGPRQRARACARDASARGCRRDREDPPGARRVLMSGRWRNPLNERKTVVDALRHAQGAPGAR